MYVRFVLPQKHPDTGVESGVFDVAYALQRGCDLVEHEREELGELLRWFGAELSVPTRFNRTKSKAYSYRVTKGISWLKSSSEGHVKKMHRMAEILRDQGHHVEMIKSSNPGYIVYQDEHQVVAEPFNDIRKRL